VQTIERPPLPIDPRIRQRRAEVAAARSRRRMRAALGVAGVTTLLAAGLGVVHSPLLGLRQLRLRGVAGARASAVLAVSRLRRGVPLIDIGPGVARRIEALAWVAEARVAVSWPDTVTLTVTTRRPVGQLVDGQGAALLDASGRVVAVVERPVADLPILTGIGSPPGLGQWLARTSGWDERLGSVASLAAPPAAAAAAAATPAEVVLAAAAGLAAAGVRVTRIRYGPDGRLGALLDGTVVVLGPPVELAAKLAALRALAAGGFLRSAGSVDLEVPERPAITPAGLPPARVGAAVKTAGRSGQAG
jgi:hypothetical protein